MIKLVTDAAVEPLLIAQAKLYLKVDTTDDDTLITSLIKGARTEVERILGYKLINQTWDYFQERFTNPIRIPILPLVSVTHVNYLDADNAVQTVAASDYRVFVNVEPGQIKPVSSFPVTGLFPNSVNVRFVAGLAAASAGLPHLDLIQRAIYLIMADAYEYRENSQPSHSTIKHIPSSAKNILMDLRSYR